MTSALLGIAVLALADWKYVPAKTGAPAPMDWPTIFFNMVFHYRHRRWDGDPRTALMVIGAAMIMAGVFL